MQARHRSFPPSGDLFAISFSRRQACLGTIFDLKKKLMAMLLFNHSLWVFITTTAFN